MHRGTSSSWTQALLIVVLGLGVSSAAAGADALHEGNGRREATRADLSIRYESHGDAGRGQKPYAAPQRVAHPMPSVPEPAALILFGVGCLVASRTLAGERS